MSGGDPEGEVEEVALDVVPRAGRAVLFVHETAHESLPLPANSAEVKFIVRGDVLFAPDAGVAGAPARPLSAGRRVRMLERLHPQAGALLALRRRNGLLPDEPPPPPPAAAGGVARRRGGWRRRSSSRSKSGLPLPPPALHTLVRELLARVQEGHLLLEPELQLLRLATARARSDPAKRGGSGSAARPPAGSAVQKAKAARLQGS